MKALDGGSSCPPADNVAVACTSACDCPSGQVCCGSREFTTAKATCTTVAAGDSCPGATVGTGAQFCLSSAECTNGMACTTQSCAGGTQISACGVQTQSPYDCSAADAGP